VIASTKVLAQEGGCELDAWELLTGVHVARARTAQASSVEDE